MDFLEQGVRRFKRSGFRRNLALFRRLAAKADAVACNLRGDVHAKLGLTHDALKDINPAIVCAHLSAYGRSGPRADWRCDGGAAFSMRLNNAGNAEVFAGGQGYNLPGVQTGSGTRYTNGSVEYWERGDEATLNGAHGGPYNNCRRG